MDSTGALSTGPSPARSERPLGSKVGRYLVLDRLGGGGGGEVFSAFDPVLDRKVALKFLRRANASTPTLLHEARLLAKVTHRAVVEVYEVAMEDGQPFMAMELVDRGDLERFAADARANRHPATILAALISVAEGIIAAHDAGVVHGDIKPSNVLRNAAGEFKVSDFGIARVLQGDEGPAPGRPVGTPTFMAPEQHAGAWADPRSDQYSFCLTAWRCLTGCSPFDGTTSVASSVSSGTGTSAASTDLEQIEADKRNGPPTWPTLRGVPAGVGEALRRGLQPDPAQRWADMRALLGALRPDLQRARRRRNAVLVGGLSVAVAGGFGVRHLERERRIAHCHATAGEIASSYDPAVAAAVHDALLADGSTFAAATADRVVPRLDAWAQQWGEQRASACTAVDVERRWDATTAARAQWCLQEHRAEFDAVLDTLQAGGDGIATHAVGLVAGLPTTEGCTDPGVLAGHLDPPTATMLDPSVRALAELSRARALIEIGKFDEGLAVATDARAAMQAAGTSSLIASALAVEGDALAHTRAFEAAATRLTDAYTAAATARNWPVAAQAAERLIFVVGRGLGHTGQGAMWEAPAQVAATLGGDPLHLHEAARTANLAMVHTAAGQYDVALPLHARALALTEAALGVDSPAVASRLNSLAALHLAMGKPAEAIVEFERVLALRERILGPDHPDTLSSLNNLGAAASEAGDAARAREVLTRAVAARERTLGTDHPATTDSLDNLGAVLSGLGEHDQAQRLLQRALAIKERVAPDSLGVATTQSHLADTLAARGDLDAAIAMRQRALAIRERISGADHPSVGETLLNLGTEHFLRGDLDQAKALFERCRALLERTLGAHHPKVAAAWSNLGDIELEAGRPTAAIPHYAHAHAIWSETLGDDHPMTATALAHWGAALRDAGQAEQARATLQRAVLAFDRGQGAFEQDANARMDLAEAILATGGERAQAVQRAEEARERYERLGQSGRQSVAAINAWIARAQAPAD